MSRFKLWIATGLALLVVLAVIGLRQQREAQADVRHLTQLLEAGRRATYVALVQTELPQMKGRPASRARLYHAPGGLSRGTCPTRCSFSTRAPRA